MKTIISIGLGLLLLVSCKSLSSDATANAQKMTDLIESGNYEVILDFANPMASNEISRLGLLPLGSTSSRIDLTGNSNYIEFKGDSLSVNLSFYGTRYMGTTTINNDGGIVFEGRPKNYKTSYNEKKQRTTISFEMKEQSELYDVLIDVYPSSRAYVSVNSSYRSSMSYDGSISELKEE